MDLKKSFTLGLTAMLAAQVLLPVSGALSKLMVAEYSAEQITWIRSAVHSAILLPFVLRAGGRLPLGVLHLARALAFIGMSVPYIAALWWMPLADAQAVFFTFPLMVMGYSALMLGRQVGPVRWTCAALGLVGVLLVVQPGFRLMTPGVGLVAAAAICGAAFILLTRRLTGSAPQSMMLAMPAFAATVLVLPQAAWHWVTPDPADLGILVLTGALSALVHLLLIIAYSNAEPSALAPLAYLQLVFGIVLGWSMFGDVPGPVAAAGMALIAVTGVVIALRGGKGAV